MTEWSKLFPNKGAFITFFLYIVLFVLQGVLVTATKRSDGYYDYNTTLVVFLTETFKLVVSAVMYMIRRENKPTLCRAVIMNYKLLMLYFIPSLLYCFYNNLAFINLSHYDPTSYYILLQFRVVITALLFQCLFSKRLELIQWVSLVILTLGCVVKNFDASVTHNETKWINGKLITDSNDNTVMTQIFNIYFVSINFQNLCSCLAGTYNEYLLKKQGCNVDIFLQNVFMYLDSIVINFFILWIQHGLNVLYFDFISIAVEPYVVMIIINSGIVGIVTSFFLKNLNSILKTYASAMELVITAFVCYILFNILITWYTVLSICLVSTAVAMYFKNPVNNATSNEADALDKKQLLDDPSNV